MKKLKVILIAIVMLGIMLVPIGTVKAGLQANPNTHYKKDTLPNWILNARKMEEAGGSLGLNETLNNDLTPSSDSNKIDMHMMRSTEYGIIAILSASGYGNPQKLQESTIKTTTGNKTGVYFSGANWGWEYVAGGLEAAIPNGVNPIYYDKYTGDSNITKVGDALGTATTENPGCRGWHSASYSVWCGPYFFRGGDSLFSFYGQNLDFSWVGYGRGVAVCGVGL